MPQTKLVLTSHQRTRAVLQSTALADTSQSRAEPAVSVGHPWPERERDHTPNSDTALQM